MNDNNANIVKEQYKNPNNLLTRISIHDKYSTNKQGFANWIVSQYRVNKKSRILELGCGTGSTWKNYIDFFDNIKELVMTDFSQGMLETTIKYLVIKIMLPIEL